MNTGTALYEVKDLRIKCMPETGKALFPIDNISLSLKGGRVLGITGELGCSDMVFVQALMGIIQPSWRVFGNIFISSVDILGMPLKTLQERVLGTRIVYIPRPSANALSPTLKVFRFITDVVRAHEPARSKRSIREMAERHFQQLDLPIDLLGRYAFQLSGFERQRVVLAISTLLSPDVVIVDEPFGGNAAESRGIVRLLNGMLKNREIGSIIYLTGNLPLLREISDDMLVMYAGQSVESGATDSVFSNPAHPYTKMLLESGIWTGRPEAGGAEDLSAEWQSAPGGCRYAGRCPYAMSACKTLTDIPMVPLKAGHAYRCLLPFESLRKASSTARENPDGERTPG